MTPTPYGRLAREIEALAGPRNELDRQWAWRDLMLEVTYNEEDAERYRLARGCRPWTAPRGVWSGG